MSAPTGTLVLLARLSKQAQRATPEAAAGISRRHYMALWAIQDTLPQAALAEALGIDANNTVILLNELEERGWVTRGRNPADRRRHVVQITEAGRAAVAAAVKAREPYENEILGALSLTERQTLHHLLAKALGDIPE